MKRRGSATGSSRKVVLSKARKASLRVSIAHVQEQLDHALRERDEALGQVSATSEILKIISKSPGELEPVFDAMLANATRICEAKFGLLFRHEGGAFHVAAIQAVPPAFAKYLQGRANKPGPETGIGRVVKTHTTIHVLDA